MYAPGALEPFHITDTPGVVWAHAKIAANVALYLSHSPSNDQQVVPPAWAWGSLTWSIVATIALAALAMVYVLVRVRGKSAANHPTRSRSVNPRPGYGTLGR